MADDLHITGIALDTRKAIREIDRLDRELKQAERRIDNVTQSTRRSERAFGSFGKAIAGAAAAFGAFQAAERAGRFIFETNKQFQQLEARLVSVTGSIQQADAAFRLITDFAVETPFQIQNLLEAFTQLQLRGLDPTADMLRDLGNFAAAFGRDITDVTSAILRAAEGGTERLRESFGIPIEKEGERIRVTFQGVTREVEANADAMIGLFRDLARENFGDAMSRQMDTLVGSLSNLEDTAALAANAVGEEGLNQAIQELAGTIEDAIEDNEEFAKSLGTSLANGVRVADGALQLLVRHTEALTEALEILMGIAVGRGLLSLGTRLAATTARVGSLSAAIVGLAGGPAGAIASLAGIVGVQLVTSLMTAKDETRALAEELEGLSAGAIEQGPEAIRGRLEALREEERRLREQGRRFAGARNTARRAGTLDTGQGANIRSNLENNRRALSEVRQEIARLEGALEELSSTATDPTGGGAAGGGGESFLADLRRDVMLLEAELNDGEEAVQRLEDAFARRDAELGDANARRAKELQERRRELERQIETQEELAEAEQERIDANLEAMEEQREMVRQIHEQAQRRVQEFSSNLELARIQEEIREAERIAQSITDALVTPLNEFIAGTEDAEDAFADMVTGILEQMQRIAIQETVGTFLTDLITGILGPEVGIPGVDVSAPDASAPLPGITPPAPIPDPGLPPAPGFAHGGSFEVPGGGNTDTKLVRFMATPGEQVTVDRKGRGGGGHPAMQEVHNHKTDVNLHVADVDSFRTLLRRHGGDILRIVREGARTGAL